VRKSTEDITAEDRKLAVCDKLTRSREPKWKSGIIGGAGGKPLNAAAVCEYGAADCGVAATNGLGPASLTHKKMVGK